MTTPSIKSFIQHEVLAKRFETAAVMVVYDPDRRYRELCLELAAENRRVVDASESSIESREGALATLQELGRADPKIDSLLVYVPAPPPLTDEEKQRDPFSIYGVCGTVFPEGDGDEYLTMCLKAKPDHATEIRRIFSQDPSPSFAVIDAVGSGGRKRIGIVGFWDTVAFDEVAGIKIRDPDAIQIMKDYMANGRFSRGVEVIADASMAFVGNIDYSIEQLVHSTQHDLFMTLPKEFDLAVMDRLACYLPGWEMPKTGSEYLTANYGFITDYLAEAFHYQLAHTNRYEEVTQRIRLGPAVEGRDEKAIKKTVCGLLKILHPEGQPPTAEFEQYVAYAVECRRRVKEQMNKRKPDDEFAKIGLSYFTAEGKEVVVYCPESKDADATQQPVRKPLAAPGEPTPLADTLTKRPKGSPEPPAAAAERHIPTEQPVEVLCEPEPNEQHFTILYGDTGRSYESIIGPYLKGAKEVHVEDPYIRLTHQIQNFVRFCETVAKLSAVKKIRLVTGYDDEAQLTETKTRLDELAQSLLEMDIVLEVKLNRNLHDREIRLDNGWVIKIGRGLDFYQKPASWFEVGANDLSLRKCLETKVDIFRSN